MQDFAHQQYVKRLPVWPATGLQVLFHYLMGGTVAHDVKSIAVLGFLTQRVHTHYYYGIRPQKP